MKDILKIAKSLEDSGLFLDEFSGASKNETKEEKGRLLSMLFDTLGASLLGNMLADKGVMRAEEGAVTVGYESKRPSPKDLRFLKKFFIPPHPLTNFEIQAYYQSEPKFNGVYSRDNPPNKIKDEVYVINLDKRSDIETHWIVLMLDAKTITYFEIKKKKKRSKN